MKATWRAILCILLVVSLAAGSVKEHGPGLEIAYFAVLEYGGGGGGDDGSAVICDNCPNPSVAKCISCNGVCPQLYPYCRYSVAQAACRCRDTQ
jgi:hypothetical protein